MIQKIINWWYPPKWELFAIVDFDTAVAIGLLIAEYKHILNKRLEYKIVGTKVYKDINYKGKYKINDTILNLLPSEE